MKLKASLIGLSLLLILSLFASPAFAADHDNRIQGQNRFETAVEISKEGWEDGADHVILTTGMDFPDALAATPLAYDLDAPILLTGSSTLNAAAAEEIERLDPDHVTIIGGELAVSAEIEAAIEAMEIDVNRIGGDNRFHTAHLIALELGTADRAVLATGMDFPDALAVAPYAARQGYPILLTLPDRLHSQTVAALEAVENDTTYIIGGELAISANVQSELTTDVTRIAGQNRYATSVEIIETLMSGWGTDVYVATGASFPDSLAGSVLAAKEEVPVFLTHPDRVMKSVLDSMDGFGVSSYTLLGGELALNSDVAATLENLTRVSGDLSEVSSQSWDLFQLINHERTENELDPLRLNVALTDRADFWSDYMMKKDFLGEASAENDLDTIVTGAGFDPDHAHYDFKNGLYPATEVMDYWLGAGVQSREKLMNEDINYVGVGFAYDEDRPEANLAAPFWTTIFYEDNR